MTNDPGDYGGANTVVATMAMDWIGLLLAGDMATAWERLDDEFRLAIVQGFIVRMQGLPPEQDLDELANELAVERPDHRLWLRLRTSIHEELMNALPGIADEPLHAGQRPRPLAPDLELVRLFPESELQQDPATGRLFFGQNQWARVYSVIMRQTSDGWRVGGIGEHLLSPGWPPTSHRIARFDD